MVHGLRWGLPEGPSTTLMGALGTKCYNLNVFGCTKLHSKALGPTKFNPNGFGYLRNRVLPFGTSGVDSDSTRPSLPESFLKQAPFPEDPM